MTLNSRNQIAALFASIACAFITIGLSMSPAITATAAPIGSLFA